MKTAEDYEQEIGVASRRGAWDLHRELCEGFVREYPQVADAHRALGFAHKRAKEFALAALDYATAISLAPEEPDYYFNLAMVLMSAKQFSQALRTLAAVEELEASKAKDYYIGACRKLVPICLLQLGQFSETIEACLRIPDDEPIWTLGGLWHRTMLIEAANERRIPERGNPPPGRKA